MKAILGEKVGMTQIFDDQARAIPVTVIKAGPCHVTQIKTNETDGYSAVQISFEEMRPSLVNKPTAGHYAKAGVAPARHIVELRVEDPTQYELGQSIDVTGGSDSGFRVVAGCWPSLGRLLLIRSLMRRCMC